MVVSLDIENQLENLTSLLGGKYRSDEMSGYCSFVCLEKISQSMILMNTLDLANCFPVTSVKHNSK